MPIYQVRCVICGKKDEMFRKVEDYLNTPLCCETPMERMLSAPQVIPDIQPYRSMATGEMITSRKRHRDHLKERGLVEIGDQHKAHQEHLNKQKEAKRKKDYESLKQEVAARVNALPTK